MVTDKEFIDNIHSLIHSLRLIDNYKPSEAERKLSRWVIEKFKDDCKECREREEQLKSSKPQKSFLSKIKEAMD